MKFAVHLGGVNIALWGELAEAADRLGFESVWLPEHVIVPMVSTGSPHDGSDHPPIPSNVPMLDVMAVMAQLAARTTQIRLGTNVYNVGLRHPFLTARAAMTVDVLSGGRLNFGVGVSWLRAEWEALGLDFDTRGARVDETLEILQRLWTEDVVEHHGRFFDFGPVQFEPKPVQPLGPALHIGGDGPAALRRAATIGVGWMPMNHTLEQLPASLAKIAELAEKAGRETPVEVTLSADISSTSDIERYRAAGVTRAIVRPWRRSREAIDGITAFAAEFFEPGP